jgi:integrase
VETGAPSHSGADGVLQAAELPSSLPHNLRHTLAVRLIGRGAPLTYVRDLLGHSSITVRADVDARHSATGDRALFDRQDEASGGRAVAVGADNWSRRAEFDEGGR